MVDELTKLPLAQRRAFCKMLLADQIETWAILMNTPPSIIIAHKDYPPCSINDKGEIFPLAPVWGQKPPTYFRSRFVCIEGEKV
jgi:hypothetical protein